MMRVEIETAAGQTGLIRCNTKGKASVNAVLSLCLQTLEAHGYSKKSITTEIKRRARYLK